MKASFLNSILIPLPVLLLLGLVLTGCKKETPPHQEQAVTAPQAQDQAAKEKEFLSSPDAVTCELEKTTISKLNLPQNNTASFIHRMQRDKRENVKQAQITLANRPYKIILGDKPEHEFYLYDTETGKGPYWWGSWSLHSYHKIGDAFFEFMLIEDGNKIAARPYKGPLGTIMAGKGGRELEKVEFNGSVHQKENVAAPIGIIEDYWTGSVTECKIPAGDYTAYLMKVTYNNLAIDISNNYHTNVQGQSAGKEIVYGMQVRQDKPYVLDFSNEPMVIFDQPPKTQTNFSRGDEIKFAAVLIDPKLDIMIRGLDDTSVKVDKEYKDSSGKVVHTAKVEKSLDPNVVIARADGEVIAKGVMPFG
ncbi:MAG: hypothetical protein JXA81_03925 [Sedimentisphaerales bacterium]|nr:hypothetical protein [Sedimentisphaerales bacterium]